jgi:tRNA/rRNA methyltransferase
MPGESPPAVAPGSGPGAPFDRVRFILVEPSHAGNIGSSARAIRTMGFDRLYVVSPRDPQFKSAPEAIALAAGAGDVLAQASVFNTLDQALAGVQLAFATTGYAREFAAEPVDVRAAATACAQALVPPLVPPLLPPATLAPPATEVAFVFGPERTGLSNADVRRCHQCCSIPADPLRASLNLSQAAQVVAYETRRALLAARGAADVAAPRRDATLAAPRDADPPAGVEQTEALFAHLEQGLVAVGYLDPDEPKHLLARLRRLLLRARPTVTEVDILRGIASAMVLPRKLRAGSKKPADPQG